MGYGELMTTEEKIWAGFGTVLVAGLIGGMAYVAPVAGWFFWFAAMFGLWAWSMSGDKPLRYQLYVVGFVILQVFIALAIKRTLAIFVKYDGLKLTYLALISIKTYCTLSARS